MEYAKVLKAKDNRILLELIDDEINENYLQLLARGGDNYVKLRLLDNKGITGKQRKLSYALIRDIALFTGDEPECVKEFLRFDYEAKTGEIFSHASATCNEATEWIAFLIKFVLKHRILLKQRYEYLLENNAWFYYCLMYGQCCICREKSDIAHVEAVGMGRNRNKINHEQHHFMALCRKHHTEQRQIGLETFIKLYKIIPVKLSQEDLKKLRIGDTDAR